MQTWENGENPNYGSNFGHPPPPKKKKIISFFLSFTSTSHKFFLAIILYNLKENQWTKLDFVSL